MLHAVGWNKFKKVIWLTQINQLKTEVNNNKILVMNNVRNRSIAVSKKTNKKTREDIKMTQFGDT